MNYIFGVITKVPDAKKGEDVRGNLACAFELYKVVGRPTKANGYMEPVEPLDALVLAFRSPVFDLGEILVLHSPSDREVCGKGRKPSKWNVTCENFDNIDDAVAKSKEVCGW